MDTCIEYDAVLEVLVRFLELLEADLFGEYLVRKLLYLARIVFCVRFVVHTLGVALYLDYEVAAFCRLHQEIGEIPRIALAFGVPVLEIEIVVYRVYHATREVNIYYGLVLIEIVA